MATEKTNPKTTEKKEPQLDDRELKLKKECQPDAGKPASPVKQPPRTMREIDFMGWD